MKRSATLILVFIGLGCSPRIDVTSEFKVPFDPSVFATYAWAPVPADRKVTAQREAAEKDVQQAVNRELLTRGYRVASLEIADLVVRQEGIVVVNVEEISRREERALREQEQMSMAEGLPPTLAGGQPGTTREGTLLLYLNDAKSERLIWQGRAEAVLDYEGQGRRKVPEAVRLLLEDFPARTEAGD